MKKLLIFVLLINGILTFQACKQKNDTGKLELINNFNYFQIGDGEDNTEFVELTSAQQSKLKDILNTASWKTFTEKITTGFSTTLILKNNSNDVIYFNSFKDSTLILIKYSDSPDDSIMYTADKKLIDSLHEFQNNLK